MKQIARNLSDVVDGFLTTKRSDHGSRRQVLPGLPSDAPGRRVRSIRCPVMAPNANAFAERFVRSIKSECLDRMIFFGVKSLHRAIAQYVEHYHAERNHQGLANAIIQPGSGSWTDRGPDSASHSSRRNAELLLPARGLIDQETLTAVIF